MARFSGRGRPGGHRLGVPHAGRAQDVLQVQRSWILFPKRVVFAVSNDGERWRTVGEVAVAPTSDSAPVVRQLQTRVEGPPVRYVRVDLQSFGGNPDWHAAPGEPSWLFVDEIIVR